MTPEARVHKSCLIVAFASTSVCSFFWIVLTKVVGITLATLFKIMRQQRALKSIGSDLSRKLINWVEKSLPQFYTIFSVNSSKLMHSSLLNLRAKLRFVAHSFRMLTRFYLCSINLKISEINIPSDSASVSLQQCITGTIYLRMELSM